MEWYLKVIRNYATFKGRARRKEYWMFILFNFIIGIVLSIIDNVLGLTYNYFEYSSGGMLNSLYNLFVFIPALSLMVRRLHDVNKSGWLIGIMYIGIGVLMLSVFSMITITNYSAAMVFIPSLIMIAYCIYLFVLTVTEGDSGPNQYGEDPKALVDLNIENDYTS